MFTHSAAHVLDNSKDHSSALSSWHEKIYTQYSDNDLRELSETQVGYPKSCHFTGSTVSVMPEDKRSVMNLTCSTGSNLHLEKEGALQRRKLFNRMPKFSTFTLREEIEPLAQNTMLL